jgi:ATP synthase F1, epsilon subunit
MLKLKIVSPEGVAYEGNVESVSVPGSLGQFQILNNHAPIISLLEAGEVIYKDLAGERKVKIVKGGFVEVQQNNVNVCVEL